MHSVCNWIVAECNQWHVDLPHCSYISMVTYCTLISILNHLTACGRNSWLVESRCKRNAWRILGESWVLAERWEEACKALQLCLLQSSLGERQMGPMEALELCSSLQETRDKKAQGFQGFSLSNQLLIAVYWLMQALSSFLLFQFSPQVKGTETDKDPKASWTQKPRNGLIVWRMQSSSWTVNL